MVGSVRPGRMVMKLRILPRDFYVCDTVKVQGVFLANVWFE